MPITPHGRLAGTLYGLRWLRCSECWQKDVLKDYPNLHLNFGHSGSPGATVDAFDAILPIMTAPGTQTRFVYGDLAYPSDLTNPDAYARLLETLVSAYTKPPGAALKDRLMYGTDWLMLLQEPDCDRCLAVSETAFQDVDQSAGVPHTDISYSDSFFALNAVRFLGLAKGAQGRASLETFYAKNGINTKANPPSWMKQVDTLYLNGEARS